ncbi:MAG: hypothetical protein ACREP2_03065 [Rhodanobacteraceae bacterium]
MNAADRRRLTPALGVVAVVLALLLIALWAGLGRGAHWHDMAAAPKLPSIGATAPLSVVPPLEHYAEVWQHPLFSPTRTPEPVAGGGNRATGDLQLTGVIMLPGLKMAILHDKTGNKDYRVIAGSPSRDGPSLIELHPRSAVVDVSGSHQKLELLPSPSPWVGNAAAPAQSTQAAASANVSRREGEESPEALLSRLGPRERKAAEQALSGLSPDEREAAIRAFSGLNPRQQQQAIRALTSGSTPLSAAARTRILKALIEQQRATDKGEGR